MRSLTLNEIARTAFPQLPERDGKDSNHICPYCKNQSTDTVRDTAYRGPFKAFYKLRPFTVYHCYCCTAVWSTAPPHEDQVIVSKAPTYTNMTDPIVCVRAREATCNRVLSKAEILGIFAAFPRLTDLYFPKRVE